MKCKINECGFDRGLRIILGLIVVVFAYYKLIGIWHIIGYIIGIILILTGLTGYCCLYRLFGVNTKKN